MAPTGLDLVVKPQEFFRDKVSSAAENQKVNMDEELEFYLVNLLCDFIEPGKLETVTGKLDALDTPLAIMLKNALEAPPNQRMRIYKYLGDSSLYVAGFFQDYFKRKCFDVGYYISIGSTAFESKF